MRELPKRAALAVMPLLLFLAGFAIAVDAEPPQSLGELRLVHALRGKEALQAIDHLHGKEVGGEDAYTAHYENNGAVAMLYVSKASSSGQAARQVKRMTERIQRGNTPFYHLKASEREETTVYSALGQGQIHYFYRQGLSVIWLAVDPPVARQALADLLGRTQRGVE